MNRFKNHFYKLLIGTILLFPITAEAAQEIHKLDLQETGRLFFLEQFHPIEKIMMAIWIRS